MAQRRKSGFQISYVTITYRSVFLGIFLLLALVALPMSFVYPNATGQTLVAVEVTTETVNLATSNITPGSKSQVSVAGLVTNFTPDSAAQVINDPRNEESSTFVSKGSGEARRGEERVPIGVNEKLSIPADSDSKTVETKWDVRSVGQNRKESAESTTAKFTLLPRTGGSSTISLEVNEFVQHGHSIEVGGRTEPGARVMVNGDRPCSSRIGLFRTLPSHCPAERT